LKREREGTCSTIINKPPALHVHALSKPPDPDLCGKIVLAISEIKARSIKACSYGVGGGKLFMAEFRSRL
jgi:hypothetical protein